MGLTACRKWLSLSLLSILLVPYAIAQKGDEVAVKEFQDRIDNYLSARKKQDIAKKPTDSPGKLAQEKQQTVEKTQAARPEAQQGDIFTPPVATYFKKQIENTLQGPEGSKVRASLAPCRAAAERATASERKVSAGTCRCNPCRQRC